MTDNLSGNIIIIDFDRQDVLRKFGDKAAKQIPYALKLGLNATAKGVMERERQELRSVFDRPTPFVVNGLRVTKWATKTSHETIIGYTDYTGGSRKRKRHATAEHTIEHHMPEGDRTRHLKSSEKWLIRAGMLRRGEILVPSRTCPRDKYGNVKASLLSKMLQDIDAYHGAEGFTHGTKTSKARYIWGAVRGRNGRLVRGIWLVEGGYNNMERGRWHLMMLAVRSARYRPVFDFYGLADQYADQHLERNIATGLQKAIETAK